MGKSFRFDFPVSRDHDIVGILATCDADNLNPFVRNIKLSVSTDGQVVIPSVAVTNLPPLKETATRLIVPVDFEKMGNKLTFSVEEYFKGDCVDTDKQIMDVDYTINVYVKTKEK